MTDLDNHTGNRCLALLKPLAAGILGAALTITTAHAKPKTTAPASPQPPIIVQVEPSDKEVEAVANQMAVDRELWGRAPEYWLVVFSGALFFGTMLLWVATRQAARTGEKAALLTLELERPYVFVRYTDAGLEERLIERTNPAHGDTETMEVSRYKGPLKLLLVNFGRSPAILTEIYEDYLWLEGQHDAPPVLNPATKSGERQAHGTVTANGDPYGISRRPSQVFGKGRKLKTSSFKDDSFFIQGFARYKDVIGNNHLLSFCAKFDREAGKFIPINDDRFNYTTIIKPRSLKNPFPRPQNI